MASSLEGLKTSISYKIVSLYPALRSELITAIAPKGGMALGRSLCGKVIKILFMFLVTFK